MTAHEQFAAIAFFLGLSLVLILIRVVLQRGRSEHLETGLLALLATLAIWFGGNFALVLIEQVEEQPSWPRALTEVFSFTGLALLPALLLHTHWLYFSRSFRFRRLEDTILKGTLILLYAQLICLPYLWYLLLSRTGGEPLDRLSFLADPFLIGLAVSYFSSAYVQVRILQESENKMERGLFQKLLILFLTIPLFNFYVFSGPSADLDESLIIAAKLSSILIVSIFFYYIYKHQFLQIRVQRTIATTLLITVMMGVYLIGIRRLALYLEGHSNLPTVLLEGAVLLVLLIAFAPLNRSLESRLNQIFGDELKRYRQIAEKISRARTSTLEIPLLRTLIAEQLSRELDLEATIHPANHRPDQGDSFRLLSGDQCLGWLCIEGDVGTQLPQEEALRLLTNAIASTLESAELIQANLKTDRKLAEKSHLEDLGRMASTVAHTVKNPLSSMKTILQLLKESENLRTTQVTEIQMVVQEINRLSKTVTDLLSFSRLESVPDRLDCKPVFLDEILETLTSLFRGDLASKQAKIECDVDPVGLQIHTNRDSLLEALTNILGNAIEASPQGGKIRICAAIHGPQLQIDIQDQGSGIPPQIKGRLFEPFVSSKAQGTGLGLATARRRIEQLKGRLESVEASISGAHFRITVPISDKGNRRV